MTVSSIIGGGIRLIRTQPQVVAIWAVLYLAGMALFMLVMRPLMASMMLAPPPTAANAAMGVKASPGFSGPAFSGPAFGSVIVGELLLLVFVLMIFAAAVRAVARPTGDRFAYLRIGMDELRLLGLGILLVLLTIVVEIAGLAIYGVIIGLFALIGGKIGSGIVGAILGVGLLAAFIYAEVRISLAGAFTVLEGRIVLKDAWRATKGKFWTLFGAYLLMSLVLSIIGIAIIAMTNFHLLMAYASFNPQAMQAAAQEQYKAQSAGFAIGTIAATIVGGLAAVVMYVVFFGAVATAAVELGGVPVSVAAEFE